jgi:hypothetical protein
MIKKMYVILLILFFINVANDIGKGIIFVENNHPSIDRIRKNAPKNNIDFDFKPTNTDTITLRCFLYASHVLSVWYFSYLFLSICLFWGSGV